MHRKQQLQEQALLQVQELLRVQERVQEQELPLSYHKQPERRRQ
jgi:hypothetical protein